MKQIDEARADLERVKGDLIPDTGVREAEEKVEALLREWWEQGCREEEVAWVGVGKRRYAELLAAEAALAAVRPTEAQWREMLAAVRADAWRAGTREREAREAMQSAIDRARGACAGNLSPGNDWIDELIGLLRVTRGQRDDAERQIGQWRAAGEAKVAECDRLAKVAEEARRDYAVAAKQIEWDRAEIAKLTLSANELDATNKKIHADRDRMAAAMREALDRLQSPGVAYGQAIEILSTTLKGYESITEVSSYKDRYFPEGAAFRSTCACGRHVLPSSGYVDDGLGHHKGKRCNLTIWASRLGAFAFDLEGPPQNLPRAKGEVEVPQIATRAWVEAEIVRQYRDEIIPRVEKRIDEKIKAYANDPKSVFVGKLRCK